MGPFPRVKAAATDLRSPNGGALGPFVAPAPPHATPAVVEVFVADAAAVACKANPETSSIAREDRFNTKVKERASVTRNRPHSHVSYRGKGACNANVNVVLSFVVPLPRATRARTA